MPKKPYPLSWWMSLTAWWMLNLTTRRIEKCCSGSIHGTVGVNFWTVSSCSTYNQLSTKSWCGRSGGVHYIICVSSISEIQIPMYNSGTTNWKCDGKTGRKWISNGQVYLGDYLFAHKSELPWMIFWPVTARRATHMYCCGETRVNSTPDIVDMK